MTAEKKIYLPGGYTYRNKGDALLVLALIQRLQRRYGAAAEITVASWTPDLDQPFYGVPTVAEVLMPWGGALERLKSAAESGRASAALVRTTGRSLIAAATAWGALARRSPETALRLVPARYRERLRPLLEADLVVGIPGGYLMAPRVADVGWLSHWFSLVLAVSLGKPTYLSPCSIGPFAPGHDTLAAWLLARVDGLGVRERTSLGIVSKLAPGARTVLTTDTALGYDFGVQRVPHEGRRLGVSVRHYYFPRSPDPEAASKNYVDAVAAAVETMTDSGWEVVFVPQVRAGGVEDDATMAHQVRDAMSSAAREHATVVEGDLSMHDLATLYASFDVLLGTRMHANIIALRTGTPVVAIAYEHKTAGIMADLGLSEFVVDIDSVETDALVSRLHRVLDSTDDYHETLRTTMPEAEAALARWDDSLPAPS